MVVLAMEAVSSEEEDCCDWDCCCLAWAWAAFWSAMIWVA